MGPESVQVVEHEQQMQPVGGFPLDVESCLTGLVGSHRLVLLRRGGVYSGSAAAYVGRIQRGCSASPRSAST